MLASKRKRYLSGPDWVISTLDHAMKASTGCGNMSQIVFTVDAPLDGQEIRSRLEAFARRFPVLEGRVRRDLKLSPYWAIPRNSEHGVLFTLQRFAPGTFDTSLPRILEQIINTPFPDERTHVAFTLLSDGERSVLVMTFDHRIFDARGAEMFMDLLQQGISSGFDTIGDDLVFTSTAALDHWSRKFLAGRSVNRRIIALTRSAPVALSMDKSGSGRYRYRLLAFSEQETADIYEQAYREAGYLLESPYLLSVIIQSMHDMLKSKPSSSGTCYLIPVTTDLRPGLEPRQEIFFNHVSYLFYQVPLDGVDDRRGIIDLLKQQMYDQVKAGFPKDLAEASLLTRIAPLSLLGKLLQLPTKGRMATFAFSHLGKSSYRQPVFAGAKIGDLVHMPRVPLPPGIGFFSNYFNNRLNIVLAYLDGILGDADVAVIEQGIRQRFGVAHDQ